MAAHPISFITFHMCFFIIISLALNNPFQPSLHELIFYQFLPLQMPETPQMNS